MTTNDILNTIEENVGLGASATSDLMSYHVAVEARASKTVEQDISSIQDTLSCLKGMCSLQWKPSR